MALETVTALLAGISGSDETRRLIATQALDRSAVDAIKPAIRLTSPVVRGAWAGEVEAYAVTEGGTKTTTSGVMSTVNYAVKAIAIAIPVSDLLYTSQEDLRRGLVDQLTAGLARGIDRTILRDTESVFGYSVIAAASGVSNKVTAASATAITYTEMSNLFGVVEADGFSVDGVIAREANKGAFRLAETTGGNRFWVPPTEAEPASVFGARTEFVKSNGSLPVLPGTSTGAEVMVVAGDWARGLHWGMYGDVQIKVNPYDSTYFLQNKVLVLAEVYMGFAILDNNAFGILSEPA